MKEDKSISNQEKKPFALKDGDKVVLPPSGVGTFIGKIKMDIDGSSQTFFKIKFDADNIETMIPENRYHESGIRKIISKSIATKVIEVFSKPPKHQKGPWNKKMQEYDAKIHSGVLMSVAEVARDGFSCSFDPNKSYTERAKYKKALDIIAQELAIVFDKGYDEMEKEIIEILKSKQIKSKDDKFDEEELEDIEIGEDFDEEEFFSKSK
jgi:CarD family transcriptional regulator